MWVLLLGLFLWGFLGVFLGTITDGPKLTQSMSTLRMYLHEYLSRNLWHLHPYHFSFLSITHTTEVEFLLVSINNHNPVYHWHYPPTRMAVVIALINVLGYNGLVSGGNKTLCKHNREPPYLPATMSIKVKMMGETLFWKSVNQTFLFQRNKMENSTTSCAAGDCFALSSLTGHNLQNPYLGPSHNHHNISYHQHDQNPP